MKRVKIMNEKMQKYIAEYGDIGILKFIQDEVPELLKFVPDLTIVKSDILADTDRWTSLKSDLEQYYAKDLPAGYLQEYNTISTSGGYTSNHLELLKSEHRKMFIFSSMQGHYCELSDLMPGCKADLVNFADCFDEVILQTGIVKKQAKEFYADYDPDIYIGIRPFIVGDYFVVTEHPNDLNMIYLDEKPYIDLEPYDKQAKWFAYNLSQKDKNLSCLDYCSYTQEEANNDLKFKDQIIKILDLLHLYFDRKKYSLQIKLVRKDKQLFLIGVNIFAETDAWDIKTDPGDPHDYTRIMGSIGNKLDYPVVGSYVESSKMTEDHGLLLPMSAGNALEEKFIPSAYLKSYVIYGLGLSPSMHISNSIISRFVLRNNGVVLLKKDIPLGLIRRIKITPSEAYCGFSVELR